jgi:hypothetical protein
MGIFDFLKRKTDHKSNSIDSLPERENKSNSTSKTYIELEEFLYLANKMVINNQASTDTAHIKAFIKHEISETELNVVKEEIKYFMFCLLHFYTYAEIAVNKKILNVNDEKAQKHFMTITYNSLERSFLTSLNDFDYTIEKYKNRYAKYTQYLGNYKYQDFERSFLECFAAQLTGGFKDNPISLNIDLTQILLTARWVYRTYGESTKLTLSKQNFII